MVFLENEDLPREVHMSVDYGAYGSEKPEGYRPRVVDERIRRMLGLFGALEIRGPKWCGKSWSAYAFGESVAHIDDESIRSLVQDDLSLALAGRRPHVIDEWQDVPRIWDAVRRSVDASGGARGSYILTGSSTPEKEKVSHSGAGRIARIDMGTMSLWELGASAGTVSLAGLFEGEFTPAPTDATALEPIAEAVCRGGWPALMNTSSADAQEALGEYLEALFEVSVPKKGGTTAMARRIAASLARNDATSATIDTIAKDALGPSGSSPSASTISFYLDMFRGFYLLNELPGWDAPVRAKSRVRTKPKRYLADPSLTASLLGASPARLLSDGQTFGLLFESLCVHDLAVYVSALPGAPRNPLRYYSDADGLEVDVVIELGDGRWAAIEIKLGESKVPQAIGNLRRLCNKVGSNPAARNPQPEFTAVLTATAPFCRRDPESGTYVFPLAALRP